MAFCGVRMIFPLSNYKSLRINCGLCQIEIRVMIIFDIHKVALKFDGTFKNIRKKGLELMN